MFRHFARIPAKHAIVPNTPVQTCSVDVSGKRDG